MQIITCLIFIYLGKLGAEIYLKLYNKSVLRRKLNAADISENNLVELLRGSRSSIGYISGNFQTFALDFGDETFTVSSSTKNKHLDERFSLEANGNDLLNLITFTVFKRAS